MVSIMNSSWSKVGNVDREKCKHGNKSSRLVRLFEQHETHHGNNRPQKGGHITGSKTEDFFCRPRSVENQFLVTTTTACGLSIPSAKSRDPPIVIILGDRIESIMIDQRLPFAAARRFSRQFHQNMCLPANCLPVKQL